MGEDASCTFNESVSIALDGALDPAALETALNAVIARHDALRGRVGRSDERMHFAARLALDLQVHDCSDEPDPDAARAPPSSRPTRARRSTCGAGRWCAPRC